jgi:hypothetical protein
MAIRRSSSNRANSTSIASFLRGAQSQIEQQAKAAQQLKEYNEDQQYQNGEISDASYLDILKSRREALAADPTADQLAISRLETKMQQTAEDAGRKRIVANIDSGTQTYADLYDFENSLLQNMNPSSMAYVGQENRVKSARNQLINTGAPLSNSRFSKVSRSQDRWPAMITRCWGRLTRHS